MHFAEFGVVMMLFLVGLELEPRLLWQLRGRSSGSAGAGRADRAGDRRASARALGLAWGAALAVGLILAMSSTAIVLQTLTENGLLKTAGGQAAFAVLLFQDIAVIPILALFPLLGAGAAGGAGGGTDGEPGRGLPGWAAALATLAAVAGVVLGGRYLARPLFRFLARAGLRELFTAAALLLVIGIALLMQAVGLSPALGTFLAGVVLADSEYRHELETDIEPFKGLLLGLFFISVGAGDRLRRWSAAAARDRRAVLGLIAVKSAVLWRARPGLPAARLGPAGSSRSALAQVGEFGFVLLSFAGRPGRSTRGLGGTLSRRWRCRCWRRRCCSSPTSGWSLPRPGAGGRARRRRDHRARAR